MIPGMLWRLHDGDLTAPGEVVAPSERLEWPKTIGIGMQHVVAMFGSTFLVPLLTGFPPATTLFFSRVDTMLFLVLTALFLVLTAGRVPSYLGSSFAFIAPLTVATKAHDISTALGGVVLSLVGAVVQVVRDGWLRALMSPAIVALIGLNLAPAAKANFMKAPVTARVTLVVNSRRDHARPRPRGSTQHPHRRSRGLPHGLRTGRDGVRAGTRRGLGGSAELPLADVLHVGHRLVRAGRPRSHRREHRAREVRGADDAQQPRRRLRARAHR